ncbi:condensin complex subunit SMC2 [Chiua virens]|nr:condensin complex subunit SMC2 [Chiua virens]
MRAQNQQDLVYKRGQAGITKASVTIVFDNSDREKSPVGLENYKQITGHSPDCAAQYIKIPIERDTSLPSKQVQNLFQSVQLNINNPNFLIMQGRITKVLNMRPQEILGMVEEAAGTRMFEDRKDKAKKTMDKKDKRVQELNSILVEEVSPKLEKFRHEKRQFLAWQKDRTELERIGRMLRAWDWTDTKQKLEAAGEDINAKKLEKEAADKQKKKLVKECKAAEEMWEEVNKKREAERKKGGKLKKLEEEAADLDKELEKFRTQIQLANDNIDEEQKKVAASRGELQNLRDSLDDKRRQVNQLQDAYQDVKTSHDTAQATLSNSEELLQTLLTGVTTSNSGNTGGGYMGQIAEAKARLAQGVAEEEQNRTKLSMNEQELKRLEARYKEVEREASQGQQNLTKMKGELEKLKRQLSECGWSTEQQQQFETELRTARGEARARTEARDAVKNRLSNLSFDYTSPYPNFDRSKVKGLVATLTSIPPEHSDKATALEIAAGGKLYNVVVQDENVGKDLLQKGKLKKRVTIIPLNKINDFKLGPDVCTLSTRILSVTQPSYYWQRLAQVDRLSQGTANVALSLIGYPNEVARAMAYVFGDTIVCADAKSANAVTGGAPPSGNGMLLRVQELVEAERSLEQANTRLAELERAEGASRDRRERWKKLSRDVEIKEHELSLLNEQIGGSNAAKLGAEVESHKQTIVELRNAVQAAKDKQKAAEDDVKRLEKDMREFKNNKEGKTSELKNQISKQKSAVQKQAVVVKTRQKEHQTAVLELGGRSRFKLLSAKSYNAQKDVSKLQDKVADVAAKHAKAEAKLQEERATLTHFDNELKQLDEAIKAHKKGISDAELVTKKLEHDMVTLEKDKVTQAGVMANLEKQYSWIREECQSFGKPGSPYDFNSVDIGALSGKADELENRQRGMKKKVNPKVMNMIETVEKKETELKKMMATVLKDKQKIEETIAELDRYKRDALQKTWEKVDGDFGAIFAELLPGNFAKLQPPEGQDLMQGLEVKVQLGSVWKQSLTELSGGQRSLIALSLIMALLQFKPAPMYILDEIDAALDLSHTQHIGQLFKNRFKGSQFIVVSLKEGLFTNANVLFRTRFRDGTSIVERTADRSGSSLYHQNDNQDNAGPRRSRRAA